MGTPSEKQVKKAMKGDKQALAVCLQDCRDSLYRVAIAIVRHPERCQDAMQEAVVEAFRSIRKLKEAHHFKTWLIRILINKCHDMNRRETNVIVMDELDHYANAYSFTTQVEIRDAVNQLEEKYRTIVVLYYFEDAPVSQIASMMEMPEGTVKNRLFRAREELAAYFQDGQKRRVNDHD